MVPSLSRPAPSDTMTSPACKPFSTMYSVPLLISNTSIGVETAFPSITLKAKIRFWISYVPPCGITMHCVRSYGTMILAEPPLISRLSGLLNIARRLTVPVVLSMMPLMTSTFPFWAYVLPSFSSNETSGKEASAWSNEPYWAVRVSTCFSLRENRHTFPNCPKLG